MLRELWGRGGGCKSFKRGRILGNRDLSWALRREWEFDKWSHREWRSVRREQYAKRNEKSREGRYLVSSTGSGLTAPRGVCKLPLLSAASFCLSPRHLENEPIAPWGLVQPKATQGQERGARSGQPRTLSLPHFYQGQRQMQGGSALHPRLP